MYKQLTYVLIVFSILNLSLDKAHSTKNVIVCGSLATQSVAGSLLPNTFPTKPLMKGRWELKVVPAYFTYKEDDSGVSYISDHSCPVKKQKSS